MASSKVRLAIRDFEEAVKQKALIGSQYNDEGDQDRRLVIEHNYVKARAKLERLMENV